jgi:2-polyprenyl-3-methyl-5-hydroxy-6-metoxy-1,4-benzoquinol methylase
MRKNMGDQRTDFSWIDIGAGDGVMSVLMKDEFPRSTGVAMDFHERPPRLVGKDIRWQSADLNGASALQGSFDLVFAITVFEHILQPGAFFHAMVRMLKPGGLLYFNCPRTDSFAFRIMGSKWPYYLPGEHITIPSVKGVTEMATAILKSEAGQFTIQVRPVVMPYPMGYYLGYLGLKRKWAFDMDLYIPTGLLEAVIHRQG